MFRRNKEENDKNKKLQKDQEIEISDDEIGEATIPVNAYYAAVSAKYSVARYLLILVLVLFVSLSLINNSESITYENLMFLIKDFSYAVDSADRNFQTIVYDSDISRSYTRYRNSLALASASGLKIYSGGGKLTFDGDEKYNNPQIEASDRYLLMYDFGGNRYSLYNSFAKIFSDTPEYEIIGADISASGMFAIVTRTKEYNSAVLLYTKNCKLRNRYLSDEYVVDVAINDKGTRICILSMYAENGSYMTKIMLCRPGEENALSTLLLSDVFPMNAQFTKNGNLAVMLNESLYYYDEDGNFISGSEIGSNISCADVSCYGAAFALSSNAVSTESSILVYNQNGEMCYSGDIDGRVLDISLYDKFVFALMSDKIIRIDTKKFLKEELEISGVGKKILVYGENDIMLCSDTKAEYCNFDVSKKAKN